MAYRSDAEALSARAAALEQDIAAAERDLDAVRAEVAEHRDRADRIEGVIAAIRKSRGRRFPWGWILAAVVLALPFVIAYLVHGR